MSVLKKSIWIFVFLLAALNIYILLSGKFYIYTAIYHNFAGIDDYKIFPNRKIPQSTNPQPWPISESYNKKKLSDAFRTTLESTESIAFLVIKNDSICYEEYWDGYSDSSHSNSFSMAKSIVSALIGVAIKEGKIKSVEQKVSDFLPEFNEGKKADITIKNILTMSSGLEWDEAYANPFSVTTEAYYGTDLSKTLQGRLVEKKPGLEFEYKSGDTQLLGFIIEKATGKSLSEYAAEKLWQPMGAMQPALWSLDKQDGHEKAYCCFNSNARDFARFGYLYLHQGNWKGMQLIDTAYVTASTTPSLAKYENGICDFYGYQWWIIPDFEGEKIFYARGILGQTIIVIPHKNIVAVRLGHSRGERKGVHFGMVYDIIRELEDKS